MGVKLDAETLSSHVDAINANKDRAVQSAHSLAFGSLTKTAFETAASPSEVQDVFATVSTQIARVVDKRAVMDISQVAALFSTAMQRVRE